MRGFTLLVGHATELHCNRLNQRQRWCRANRHSRRSSRVDAIAVAGVKSSVAATDDAAAASAAASAAVPAAACAVASAIASAGAAVEDAVATAAAANTATTVAQKVPMLNMSSILEPTKKPLRRK